MTEAEHSTEAPEGTPPVVETPAAEPPLPVQEVLLAPAPTVTTAKPAPQMTLGARLRDARGLSGLNIDDVAHAIKFSPRQIEALEADDYSRLQGATFLRGFVRSYAKFLGLDPTPLCDLVEQDARPERAEIRPPLDTGAALPGAQRRAWLGPLLIAAGVAAAGALVFGALWLLEKYRNESAAEAPAPVLAPQGLILPAEGGRTVAPQAAVPGTTAPIGPLVLSPGQHLLGLSFSQSSWVEVRDRQDRVIFQQLSPAGSHEAIPGVPPLQVVIGNAPGVRVTYDEREVDLTPYIRADVARLTVE